VEITALKNLRLLHLVKMVVHWSYKVLVINMDIELYGGLYSGVWVVIRLCVFNILNHENGPFFVFCFNEACGLINK
jgi:hypothetical protein